MFLLEKENFPTNFEVSKYNSSNVPIINVYSKKLDQRILEFLFVETYLPIEESKSDPAKKQEGANEKEGFQMGEEMGKEVLIGGDTDDNRSARGSVRERHLVKTFSEVLIILGLVRINYFFTTNLYL